LDTLTFCACAKWWKMLLQIFTLDISSNTISINDNIYILYLSNPPVGCA